ncbi:MAG: polysaccharide deacetylase family protein [Burkholderiaceae bacterium]
MEISCVRRLGQTALVTALTAYLCAANAVYAASCKGTIYLTFDTGSQSQAQFIADTLKKHDIKATFFMANEKTTRGDHSLDPSWASYWKSLADQGHAFGTHTFDHVYSKTASDGKLNVRPQFGANAGKNLQWSAQEFCAELKRVDTRFKELTGRGVDPIWRAPGGYVHSASLAAAKQCGYTHVGWSPAGFLGDELSSEKFPNKQLLSNALRDLKDGDITVAHLGIWSRKDPWAPTVLEPLITGLKERGLCFATLKDHPQYKSSWK